MIHLFQVLFMKNLQIIYTVINPSIVVGFLILVHFSAQVESQNLLDLQKCTQESLSIWLSIKQ